MNVLTPLVFLARFLSKSEIQYNQMNNLSWSILSPALIDIVPFWESLYAHVLIATPLQNSSSLCSVLFCKCS